VPLARRDDAVRVRLASGRVPDAARLVDVWERALAASVFDAPSRRIFRAEIERLRATDDAIWDRARGWALVIASAVVEQAGTSSPFGRAGACALEQVLPD
jgi:hypothetical protein